MSVRAHGGRAHPGIAALLGAVAVLGWCEPAHAQMSVNTMPLPITTPMAMPGMPSMQPASPVPRTGLGFGATELATPGTSPAIGSMMPLGMQVGAGVACPGASGFVQAAPPTGTGMPAATTATAPGFDGGGMGTELSVCATIGNTAAGLMGSAMPSSGMNPVAANGRPGITLGATELGSGGLSPMPSALLPLGQNPATAPMMQNVMPPPTMSSMVPPPSTTMSTPCTTTLPGATTLPGIPSNINATSLPGMPSLSGGC